MNTTETFRQRRQSPRTNLCFFDLNPKFAELNFAQVEAIRWKITGGHEVEGGLYFPIGYKEGVRYPLVIQTHAFSPKEFWINGSWNSVFAAQPLAGQSEYALRIAKISRSVLFRRRAIIHAAYDSVGIVMDVQRREVETIECVKSECKPRIQTKRELEAIDEIHGPYFDSSRTCARLATAACTRGSSHS